MDSNGSTAQSTIKKTTEHLISAFTFVNAGVATVSSHFINLHCRQKSPTYWTIKLATLVTLLRSIRPKTSKSVRAFHSAIKVVNCNICKASLWVAFKLIWTIHGFVSSHLNLTFGEQVTVLWNCVLKCNLYLDKLPGIITSAKCVATELAPGSFSAFLLSSLRSDLCAPNLHVYKLFITINFINFVKSCLQQILNYLFPFVNSENPLH